MYRCPCVAVLLVLFFAFADAITVDLLIELLYGRELSPRTARSTCVLLEPPLRFRVNL